MAQGIAVPKVSRAEPDRSSESVIPATMIDTTSATSVAMPVAIPAAMARGHPARRTCGAVTQATIPTTANAPTTNSGDSRRAPASNPVNSTTIQSATADPTTPIALRRNAHAVDAAGDAPALTCYSDIASYGPETRYCQGASFRRGDDGARDERTRPGLVGLGRPWSTTAEAIRLELAEAWGEMGAAWGVTPGDRARAGLPDGAPGAADRARGSRGAGPVPSRRQPRPRRGRVVGDRRARPGAPACRSARARRVAPTWRSATTGSGSAGSSPNARCARAIRSSPSSRRRSARRRRPRAADPDDRELAALREWLAAFLVFVRCSTEPSGSSRSSSPASWSGR